MKSFRVLQFNMQFGQGWDESDPDHAPINMTTTVAEIRRHNADIVFLQEVEHVRPGGTHPPFPPNYSRLQHELADYHSTFSFPRPDPRELPFGIGLAIFSKWPLLPTVCLNLPSPPLEFDFYGEKKTPTDRLLISANINMDGREVRVMNTHLLAFFMLKTTSEEHHHQRDLVELELRKTELPTVLAGDFNVSKHETLIEQFGSAGYQTAQSSEITWRRMQFVLDHVFYNSPLQCTKHQVCPTMASDHHALVVDFDLKD